MFGILEGFKSKAIIAETLDIVSFKDSLFYRECVEFNFDFNNPEIFIQLLLLYQGVDPDLIVKEASIVEALGLNCLDVAHFCAEVETNFSVDNKDFVFNLPQGSPFAIFSKSKSSQIGVVIEYINTEISKEVIV